MGRINMALLELITMPVLLGILSFIIHLGVIAITALGFTWLLVKIIKNICDMIDDENKNT